MSFCFSKHQLITGSAPSGCPFWHQLPVRLLVRALFSSLVTLLPWFQVPPLSLKSIICSSDCKFLAAHWRPWQQPGLGEAWIAPLFSHEGTLHTTFTLTVFEHHSHHLPPPLQNFHWFHWFSIAYGTSFKVSPWLRATHPLMTSYYSPTGTYEFRISCLLPSAEQTAFGFFPLQHPLCASWITKSCNPSVSCSCLGLGLSLQWDNSKLIFKNPLSFRTCTLHYT